MMPQNVPDLIQARIDSSDTLNVADLITSTALDRLGPKAVAINHNCIRGNLFHTLPIHRR
jgi:hypothetical protein